MKYKFKVTKYSSIRKIIEIPALYRDDFDSGDFVIVEKVKEKK